MAAIADGEGNWQWHSDQRLQEYIADILPKAAQVHPCCSATTGPFVPTKEQQYRVLEVVSAL